MASKSDKKFYSMTKPRLGVAIIVDNVSTPGSEADVVALHDAYDTAGFEVHTYSNCDSKEFESIKYWMCAKETHQYCNAFSLVMMCQVNDGGDLLDFYGERLASINDAVQDITNVSTLNKKPKLLMIQAYPETTKKYLLNDLPELPKLSKRNDVFLAYSQINGQLSASDGEESGSEYLQTFAQFLKAEYTNKSVQEIFTMVNAVTKQSSVLADSILMNLAENVGVQDMKAMALADFGIDAPKVNNLAHAHDKNPENFNFEILSLWRNKTTKSTRKTLAEIMLNSGRVDPSHVHRILQPNKQIIAAVQNCFSRELFLSEFNVAKTIQYEKDIQRLTNELKVTREDEKMKRGGLQGKVDQLQESKDLMEIKIQKLTETISKLDIGKFKEPSSSIPSPALKPIKIEYKTTRETGLWHWGYTRCCVMESTGDIVFFAKEKKDVAAALHIYNFKNGWNKVGKKPAPCCHEEVYIIPIEDSKRLLVSCWQCETIWFCDIGRGNFSQALKEKGFYPGLMCKAEGDYVYIVNMITGGRKVLKAKCTSTELIVDEIKTIHSKMEQTIFMEYLQDVNCIVLSDWNVNLVKALHCGTGEKAWEVKGEVGGVTWKPCGFLYLPEHKSLLVCDTRDDGRLVVVSPSDGSILQTISLSDISLPTSLSMREGNIVLRYESDGSVKICVFAIK